MKFHAGLTVSTVNKICAYNLLTLLLQDAADRAITASMLPNTSAKLLYRKQLLNRTTRVVIEIIALSIGGSVPLTRARTPEQRSRPSTRPSSTSA